MRVFEYEAVGVFVGEACGAVHFRYGAQVRETRAFFDICLAADGDVEEFHEEDDEDTEAERGKEGDEAV